MSEKYTAEGIVRHVMDTQTFASGFSKREFVIETVAEKYPQMIKFEVVKDKCPTLDTLKIGEPVKVSFNLRGQENKERFYINLLAWKIEDSDVQEARDVPAQEATRRTQPAEAPAARDNSASEPDSEDDIPFARKPAIFQP